MPGGNARGPFGMGPMTGRAAGFCAGFGAPGSMNPWVGRGFPGGGRGRGGGRGYRNRFYATGLTGWQRADAGWPAQGWGWPYTPGFAGPGVTAISREQQLEALRGQAEAMENSLEGIRKRIEELEVKARED